jgi:excisionase family DNA binding protein
MNIRTREAAAILGVKESTLEAWRCRGGGPAFLKLGKAVRYRQSDLENFMAERARLSTSEPPSQAGLTSLEGKP